MRYLVLILVAALHTSSCTFTTKEPSEEQYKEFCYDLAAGFNTGHHKLSHYFDLEVYSKKVANQINKYTNRGHIKFSNSHVFANDIDGFNQRTKSLTFNKLKVDKNGNHKAVFMVNVGGMIDYFEMELMHYSKRIYAIDYYTYTAGAYMSEISGQSMAIANTYPSEGYGKRSLSNPKVIAEDITTAIMENRVGWGWERYNMLSSTDKEMKFFEFLRIQLAIMSNDSIYLNVIDEMLKEKKRDPRFFYLQQFVKYDKLQDYNKALENLRKLNEYTGINLSETLQLATYTALAGNFKESLDIGKQMQRDYPDQSIGLVHQLVCCYLMNDRPSFVATNEKIRKQEELTGDELLNYIALNYPQVPDTRFENLSQWITNTPN